jgi:hypothetical protein
MDLLSELYLHSFARRSRVDCSQAHVSKHPPELRILFCDEAGLTQCISVSFFSMLILCFVEDRPLWGLTDRYGVRPRLASIRQFPSTGGGKLAPSPLFPWPFLRPSPSFPSLHLFEPHSKPTIHFPHFHKHTHAETRTALAPSNNCCKILAIELALNSKLPTETATGSAGGMDPSATEEPRIPPAPVLLPVVRWCASCSL